MNFEISKLIHWGNFLSCILVKIYLLKSDYSLDKFIELLWPAVIYSEHLHGFRRGGVYFLTVKHC